MLPAATATPSVEQVVAGQGSDGAVVAIRSTQNSLPLPKGIAKEEAILGLTQNTPYKLHLVLENIVGEAKVLATESFTTTGGGASDPSTDFSAPTLLGRGLHIITLPNVALIDFTPDEPISYHWILQQKNQLEPDITQVLSGKNGEQGQAIQSSNGIIQTPHLTPQTVRLEGLTPDTKYGFYLWAQDHNSPANGMKGVLGKIFQTQAADAGAEEQSRLINIPNIRVDDITTTEARVYFTPLEDVEVASVVLPRSAAHPPSREQIIAGQNRSGDGVPSGRANNDDFDKGDEDEFLEISGLEAGNKYTAYVLIEEPDGFLETREVHFSTPASEATLASLEGLIAVSVDSSGDATVTFTPTEAGSYLYVVTGAGESPPSTNQVELGQSGSGAPALQSNSEDNTAMRTLVADAQEEFVLSGLPLEASYRVHLTFEDSGQAVSSGVFSSEVFRMYSGSPVLHADIEPTVDFGKHPSDRRRKDSPVILLRVGGQNATSDITFTKTGDDRFEVEVVDGSSLVTGGVSGKVLAITMFQESSGDPSPITASLNLTYDTQTLAITLTGQSVSDTEKTVRGVPSRLNFAAVPAGESSSRSLRVFGNNLGTDNVSLSFGSTPSLFSVNQSSIAGEDAEAVLGREVIVTFSPTTATQTGMDITETLTLSYADGAEDDTAVALSGRVSSSGGTLARVTVTLDGSPASISTVFIGDVMQNEFSGKALRVKTEGSAPYGALNFEITGDNKFQSSLQRAPVSLTSEDPGARFVVYYKAGASDPTGAKMGTLLISGNGVATKQVSLEANVIGGKLIRVEKGNNLGKFERVSVTHYKLCSICTHARRNLHNQGDVVMVTLKIIGIGLTQPITAEINQSQHDAVSISASVSPSQITPALFNAQGGAVLTITLNFTGSYATYDPSVTGASGIHIHDFEIELNSPETDDITLELQSEVGLKAVGGGGGGNGETLGSQPGGGLSLIQGILPNPAESSVSIRLSKSAGRGSSVRLFSVAGKLVGEQKTLETAVVRFDLSGKPPGIYIVKARDTAGNHEVDKLVLK